MSLSGYTPERQTISLPRGQSFSVRGISVEDFSALLRDHLPHLDQMFDLFSRQTKDVFATGSAQKLVLTAIRDFPQIAAMAIALAADEPGTEAKAAKLPLPTQMEALMAIGRLTFEEVGGPKKFFASLQMLTAGLAPRPVAGAARAKQHVVAA